MLESFALNSSDLFALYTTKAVCFALRLFHSKRKLDELPVSKVFQSKTWWWKWFRNDVESRASHQIEMTSLPPDAQSGFFLTAVSSEMKTIYGHTKIVAFGKFDCHMYCERNMRELRNLLFFVICVEQTPILFWDRKTYLILNLSCVLT